MTPLEISAMSGAVAALSCTFGVWWGRCDRLRRLRRYALTRDKGTVEDMAFQAADDGAVEILLRRRTVKDMLTSGQTLEGKLQGAKGAAVFRVRLQ